ncbi:MAG: exodeoxyribonuclease VII small subunit [Legionellales bacterium]|nr:exodeoxyribonuclease VII small subunit [Legionellales bacterium]
MTKPKPIHFEKSMTELKQIVVQLERGDLSLEDALDQFEKGISIARLCQDVLTAAEQKIEILTLTKTAPNEDISEKEHDE